LAAHKSANATKFPPARYTDKRRGEVTATSTDAVPTQTGIVDTIAPIAACRQPPGNSMADAAHSAIESGSAATKTITKRNGTAASLGFERAGAERLRRRTA